MKRPLISISLLIILLLVISLACDNAESDVEIESNRWLNLMSAIPADEVSVKAAFLRDDILKTTQLEQFPDPAFERLSLFEAITMPFVGASISAYNDESWKNEMGFVKSDIESMIVSGFQHGTYYAAARGRFDSASIDTAMTNNPLADELKIISYADHQYYSFGPDQGVNLLSRSDTNPAGQSYRLAIAGDMLLSVMTTDCIEKMLDSYYNQIDSLADIEAYRAMAEILEDHGVFYALFSSQSFSQNSVKTEYREFLENALAQGGERNEIYLDLINSPDLLLEPYDALSTGAGVDESGAFLLIVLSNENEELAGENAVLLEQRLDNGYKSFLNAIDHDFIKNYDIVTRDNLTVAKIYGDIWQKWDAFTFDSFWFTIYEPLLMTE